MDAVSAANGGRAGVLREGRGAERAASSRGTFVVLAEAWAWGQGEKWREGVLLSNPHWAKWQRESLTAPWGLFDGMWSYSPPGHVCRCLPGCKIRNSYTHGQTHIYTRKQWKWSMRQNERLLVSWKSCECLIQIPVTGRMLLQLIPKAVPSARVSTNSAEYDWRSFWWFYTIQFCGDKQKVRR